MKLLMSFLLALGLLASALAGPGPHGPNGEHLDAPAAAAGGGGAPRFESSTKLFELVGRLSGEELSVLVDRYETNEPVLNGKLEVEYKGIKAQAKFHADMGDYAFDDPKLLAALGTPGKHPLAFRFATGAQNDLLAATLEVPADDHHAPGRGWLAYAGAAVVAILTVMVLLLLRRRLRLLKK